METLAYDMQPLQILRSPAAESVCSYKPAEYPVFPEHQQSRAARRHLYPAKLRASKHFTNGVTQELRYPGSASVPVVYRPRCIETGEVLFMKGDIHFATGNQNKLNEVAAPFAPGALAFISMWVPASSIAKKWDVDCSGGSHS